MFSKSKVRVYYLNGVAGAELPSEFSGFEFLHTQLTDNSMSNSFGRAGAYQAEDSTRTLFVLIEQGQQDAFRRQCWPGDFEYGGGKVTVKLSRRYECFGQEWQVLDTDPMLFHGSFSSVSSKRASPPPQTTNMLRRRLDSSTMSCCGEGVALISHGMTECVFDVHSPGDPEMAVVG
jgi:hypothetical protein